MKFLIVEKEMEPIAPKQKYERTRYDRTTSTTKHEREGNARRKEAEEALQESFEEISMQKILIEEKNEEVLDSIKYAKTRSKNNC